MLRHFTAIQAKIRQEKKLLIEESAEEKDQHTQKNMGINGYRTTSLKYCPDTQFIRNYCKN